MILSQAEIREAVDKGEIIFDPPLLPKQWGEASVDLRLGTKFTKLKPSKGVKFSMAHGIGAISDSGLWIEDQLGTDSFGKKQSFCLDPDEFVLAITHERIQMPRNLIAMVEGRSTYARVGLSMHQTAPWIQPGWGGKITLEIRNSGPLHIELTPLDDMPCQLTFFRLTSELPEAAAYGSRASDLFQNQMSALPKTHN
jgi:dCTP deaminase